jgi:hypothetical protein
MSMGMGVSRFVYGCGTVGSAWFHTAGLPAPDGVEAVRQPVQQWGGARLPQRLGQPAALAPPRITASATVL